MIDRYTLIATPDRLAERFNAENTEPHRPQYNAGPGRLLPVILQHSPQGISYFYWGAPPAQGKNKSLAEKIINLRAESIGDKPVFQKKLRHYRCLIPADGFFVWKQIGKKTATPYRVVRTDKSLFSIAGVWEEYQQEDGEHVHTFTMITTPTGDELHRIAERMPAVLTLEMEKTWMDREADQALLLSLLQPAPLSWESYTVSPRITSTEANEASLILPAPAANQFGNLTLFD